MTWFHRLKSLIRYFLAVQRRAIVQHHTASTLDRLDDRLLADIGVPRHRIAEYARAAAHSAVPVAPLPTSGRKRELARLRVRREWRAAIRELSRLGDRLLRDIGIEPGRLGDVVDTVLSRGRDLSATHPVVQLSDAMQEVLVPARHRLRVPDARPTAPDTSADAANDVKINVDWTPDVRASRERTANESRSPEWRSRALAEM